MRFSSLAIATTALAGFVSAAPTASNGTSSASSAAASTSGGSAANSTSSSTNSTSGQLQLQATTRVPPNEKDAVSNANCERKIYTVVSEANRTVFNETALAVRPNNNQSRITELQVEFVTNPDTFKKNYNNGTRVVREQFNISGVYCSPKQNANDTKPLLVFLHGIGFDGSYWNFQGPGVPESNYSFAYAAAERGYSTFRYDRLGTGSSQVPVDGYNVTQAPTEVGVLIDVLTQARNTTNIGGKRWSRVGLTGHSYGSAQSQAASYLRPDLVDGVVLTGFSNYPVGVPFYQLATVYTQPKLVPDISSRLQRPQDWLVTATNYSNQQMFTYPAFATQDAVAQARRTEQPVTQGSLWTIGSIGGVSNFTGPVYIVTGDKDVIFTFRQNATNITQATAKALYPKSRNATYLAPANLGHGIGYHQQAGTVNRQILDFYQANGL